MARTLKLDCLTITVTEKNKSKPLEFDKFFRYKQYDGSIIVRPFSDFFVKYVESFNGKFRAQHGISKAINLSPPIGWNAARRVIMGKVTGGNTGSTVDVFSTNSATDLLFTTDPAHVTSEPFYFLLWMPSDFDKGILLIQGYTNATVTDAFKQTLIGFFKEQCPTFTMKLNTYVDKETINNFAENMHTDEIIFHRTRVASDKTDDTRKILGKGSSVKVDVKVKGLSRLEGFTDRISRWLKGEVPALFELEELDEFGVDASDPLTIKYKTPEGRRASATSRKSFEIKPQIYIDPAEVSCEVNGRPDAQKIQLYLLKELAQIQAEIGYSDAH
jgi:hypothetical protein